MDALVRALYYVAYRLQLCVWFVLRPKHPSVHVAVWVEDQLLLIDNPYKPFICVPAGGLRRGEEPVRAAARELHEEVGIEVDPDTLEFHGIVTSEQEFKRDRAHFFELELSREPQVTVDGREVVWASFVHRDALDQHDLSDPVRRYLTARS